MRQIRRSIFETNSSSTHSITICAKDEYTKWKSGEMYLNGDSFYTKEQAIKELKNNEYFVKYHPDFDFTDEDTIEDVLADGDFYTYDNYGYDHEQFSEEYTSKSGDKIIAFGYYGYDG